MVGILLNYLSRRDIEIIADKIIDKYKQLPDVDGKCLYRVEPDKLIGELLRLTVEYKHLSVDGTLLGEYISDEVEIEVYDDCNEPEMFNTNENTLLIETDLHEDIGQTGRCNFTKMHEAGHYILDRINLDIKCKVHYYRLNSNEHKVTNWYEWQADTLASYLLMPKECIMRCLHEFGIDNGIEVLNSVYCQKDFTKFIKMAEFMGVSKQALSIRLKQMGLLKECYLDSPKRMLDIEYGE